MDLLKITPAKPTKVDIDGGTVEVRGVGLRDAADLLRRFPVLLDLFWEKPTTVADLIQGAPEACAAIVAIGCGHGGEEEAEALFHKLPLESQLDLLEAIIKRTVPRGWGPFFERLATLWTTPPEDPAAKTKREAELGAMPQSYVQPQPSS